jgi:hypothetical protein
MYPSRIFRRILSSNADLMKKGLRHRALDQLDLGFKPDLMKKGLRRATSINSSPKVFKRGPDEEGIETTSRTQDSWGFPCSNADLMKKGLRRPSKLALQRLIGFKRGPDEEGIETPAPPAPSLLARSNADLMKKGLRPATHRIRSIRQASSNADLMKKGLRRFPAPCRGPGTFKRGPDEEGIETEASARLYVLVPVQTRT